MIPLLIGSLVTWTVLLERAITYRRIQKRAAAFHLQAVNLLLRGDASSLRALAAEYRGLPLSVLVDVALEKSASQDPRVRAHWRASVERARAAVAQDLKNGLWLLGTTANAAPFVGLFGTVIGILQSFQQIAAQGKGGFNTVAAGISEALIATAAGIVVAVIASIAFNALQTRAARLSTALRLQSEELFELWPNG
jgi:biopolymer transport protein ExbB/TolQ